MSQATPPAARRTARCAWTRRHSRRQSGVGQDDDEELALVLRPFCHLDRRVRRRAGADTDEDAFFLGQPAGHLCRLLARDLEHLVDDLCVQHTRHEPGADALDLVRAR